jgi:uncharacterized protein (DUF433 family)
MAHLDVLEREMYTEAEAARLLGVPAPTLHYWLDGGTQRGKTYRPVIRVEPKGTRRVTWAEFVEAALLREYRRTHKVPMPELRTFIERLRDEFAVPYPLAHHTPYISGRQLVYNAQVESQLDPDFALVAVASNQLILTPASQSFLDRVTWTDEVASAWRPAGAAEASTVRIEPDVRFGRPAVGGISTEVLWEHAEAGATPAEIAETFGLGMADVGWALAYETALHADSAA